MATDIQNPDMDHKNNISLGTRFKAAREALGLERKDVAHQLRLNEKIIIMMEKDRYSVDIPVMFVRGYIRAYAKFLQIPDQEINTTLANMKIKTTPNLNIPTLKPYKITSPHNRRPHVQILAIALLTLGLFLTGTWYYTHHTKMILPHELAMLKKHDNLRLKDRQEDRNLKPNIIPVQPEHHASQNRLANRFIAAQNDPLRVGAETNLIKRTTKDMMKAPATV